MPAPDLQGEINRALKELMRLKDRVLPVKVGRAVRDSVRDNFRKGGFYGQTWKPPMRTDLGFEGPSYGPMLSGTNHLMMSTDYVPEPGRVIIQNSLIYAQIHNEGGEITVTKKMKRYFWSKYYDAGGNNNGSMSKEAEFWRNMALKQVGSTIKMPQRQFMGDDPEVTRIVQETIEKELFEFAKKFTNGSTNH